MHSTSLMELFATLGVLGLILIGASSSVRQRRRRKEMEHAYQLKALEMGVDPTAGGMDWPSAAVCIAIGAGVPIGSFLVAWLASMTADVPHQIWMAPVVVSFPAIGTARKLAHRFIDSKPSWKPSAFARSTPVGKPAFDPEAFDLVGRRG